MQALVFVLFGLDCMLGLASGLVLRQRAGSLPAYVDPGSGALFVQLVVSVAVGVLLSLAKVGRLLRRAVPWLKGRSGQPPTSGRTGE